MIDVTRAIIVHRDAILAAQRPDTMSLPFKWELPGGKPEPGESLLDCLHREVEEELRISIRVGEALPALFRDFGGKEYRILPYLATWTGGQPVAVEHLALCWQPLDRLFELDWAPAEAKILRRWQESSRKTSPLVVVQSAS